MRGRTVTIIVVNDDGKKESKIISFQDYRKLLDNGEKPQTVGIVPELPNYWADKNGKKDGYQMGDN